MLTLIWPATAWIGAAANDVTPFSATPVALSPDGGGNVNGPPVITDFYIEREPGNLWTFEGTVMDENPGTCVIVFSGLIEGTVIPVTEEGTFSITIQLPANSSGAVGAQAWDEWDQASEVAEDFL
jgi:hypothetical protein